MRVQQHTAQPADPLGTLDEDYELAVIHVAWSEASTDQLTLLFAFVELLPTEVPPPLDDGPQVLELGPEEPRVHLRRLQCSARDALAWYLDCRGGQLALPGSEGELRPISGDALDVVRGEDPPWPSLVCPLDRGVMPFCPSWHGQPRVHRLIPQAAFPLGELWSSSASMARVTAWLEERLHFSLSDYPEYWGSIHLIAPNPVYRSMGSRLHAEADSRESILIRFEPRAGKSVDGLLLGVAEGEPWGAQGLCHVEVGSPLIRLDLERRVAGVKDEVYDLRRGVLSSSSEFLQFIREVRVQTHALPPSDLAAGPSIARPRPEKGARVLPARTRLAEGYFGRKQRDRARAQHRVFDSGADALEGVLEQIARAHRDVLIVDSQLRSLAELVDAIGWPRVPLRVLTSQSAETEPLLRELEALDDRRVELRVFGEGVGIEGQFMAVDDHLWMFNVPLHRLGRPGSFMARAPGDDSLRERLADAWHGARDPSPTSEGS